MNAGVTPSLRRDGIQVGGSERGEASATVEGGGDLGALSTPSLRRLVTDEEAKFGPAFLLNELYHGACPRSKNSTS